MSTTKNNLRGNLQPNLQSNLRDKLFAIILSLAMVLAFIPNLGLASHAVEYVNINVSSPVAGSGYTVSGNEIIIGDPGNYTLKNSTSTYTVIVLDSGGEVNLELNDLEINNSANANRPGLSILNPDTNITLNHLNTLIGGNNRAGLHISNSPDIVNVA